MEILTSDVHLDYAMSSAKQFTRLCEVDVYDDMMVFINTLIFAKPDAFQT